MKSFKKFIFEDIGDTTWIPRPDEKASTQWRPLFQWMRDQMVAGTDLEGSPEDARIWKNRYVGLDLQSGSPEKRALDSYVGWSGEVNDLLRKHGRPGDTRESLFDKIAIDDELGYETRSKSALISGLDSLIHKKGLVLPHDLIVYRSVPKEIQSGVDHGYISTSISPQFTASWGNMSSYGTNPPPAGYTPLAPTNKIIQLRVPRGTKFLPIHHSTRSFMTGENELLFPRGMHMEIGDKIKDLRVVKRPEYSKDKSHEISFEIPLHAGELREPNT